jgi:hypothetical protein
VCGAEPTTDVVAALMGGGRVGVVDEAVCGQGGVTVSAAA